MWASDNAGKLIREFEGCRLASYLCPAGKWTLGWGATGEDIKPGMKWTQAQADQRLAADIARFARGVTALVGISPTTRNQFDAMVCFAFNVGLGEDGLKGSTLLKLHKAGRFAAAADEFGKWIYSKGQPIQGLIRRRAAERALYRKGAA